MIWPFRVSEARRGRLVSAAHAAASISTASAVLVHVSDGGYVAVGGSSQAAIALVLVVMLSVMGVWWRW